MTNYSQAFADYRAAAQKAVKFHDPNYTRNAITRTRADGLHAARQALLAALPPRSEREATPDTTALDAAFAGLAVTSADTAAIVNSEWAKTKAALDGGRNLGHLIANADRRRLMAIMEHLDTDIAPGTGDVAGVTAEVSQAVLSRLADLGDAKATEAIAAQTAGAKDRAWQTVFEEASRGEVSVRARTMLKQASAEDYDAAFPDSPEASEFNLAVSHLDHVAPHLSEAVNGNASA
jgi:hypothetical protein